MFMGQDPATDFREWPGFANRIQEASGYPIYLGQDERGNRVYSLGAGKNVTMSKRMLEDLVHLLGFSSRDMIIEPVFVRGEQIFYLLDKIPFALGGQVFQRWLASVLLRPQISRIQAQVEAFKQQSLTQ